MNRLAIAVAAATLISGAANAADSACKGLDNATCTTTATCQWVPERIKGETKNAKGEPHKTSAKAHCRKETPFSKPQAQPDASAPASAS